MEYKSQNMVCQNCKKDFIIEPDNSRGNKITVFCWKCVEAEYSNNCHSCVNVFGSIGLKHASYVIFNKKYSREDYISLRARIIEQMKKTGEWGEFFPSMVSPFAYNETPALEWFPLTRTEAVKKGYRWKENKKRSYTPTKNVLDLPDTIAEVGDAFLNEVIECEHQGKCNEQCTEAFRITKRELQFYRRMNIPLPVLCPNCRHYQRFKKVNPPKLWHRQCMCHKDHPQHNKVKPCPNEFKTSYAPNQPEIVYCEKCYQQEIY